MKKKYPNLFRNILRISGTIAAVFYILFLVAEGVPVSRGAAFAEISVYLLFALFILGFIFLWMNELVSGLLLIIWYALEWILVFWVWVDGALTLILGIPIGILGIILLIYGIKKTTLQRSLDR